MKFFIFLNTYFFIVVFSLTSFAADTVELDTTIIKGNKESPAILYIVPWKTSRESTDEYQGLKIDDISGNVLKPQVPSGELVAK